MPHTLCSIRSAIRRLKAIIENQRLPVVLIPDFATGSAVVFQKQPILKREFTQSAHCWASFQTKRFSAFRGRMEQFYKIPNSKHKITNKSQFPIFNDQNLWPAKSLSAVCSGVNGPGSNGSVELNWNFGFRYLFDN
jgi:hypothetical protein